MSALDVAGAPVVGFATLVLVYLVAHNLSCLVRTMLSLGAALREQRRDHRRDERQIMRSAMSWPVSMIVAVRDDEASIVETVRSLLMVRYGTFEIVVVDDGSSDRTLERLVEAFDLTRVDRVCRRSIETLPVRAVYGSLVHSRITVVDKTPGGRADALNAGLNVCRYPLVCTVDPRAVIEDNALLGTVRPFMDRPDETVAVGGAVRVVQGCEVREGRVERVEVPEEPLLGMQIVERLRSFFTGSAGWSAPPCPLGFSGSFAVYKKEDVIAVGGFLPEGEDADLDLILRLSRRSHDAKRAARVVVVPRTVCWTRAAPTYRALRVARERRQRGLYEALWRQRSMWFRPRFGRLGLLALPHALLFEVVGPFLEIGGAVVLPLGWLLGLIDLRYLLLYLVASVLFGTVHSAAAVLLAETSRRGTPGWLDASKLILFGFLENLGHRQALALVKVLALRDVLRGRSWGLSGDHALRNLRGRPQSVSAGSR